MKAGLEDRRKVYAVIALMALAAFRFPRRLNSGGNSTVSAASTPTQPPASTRGPAAKPAPNLDPSLRLATLKGVESQEYKGSGRNIFEYAQAPLPTPISPIRPQPKCPPDCPP